MTKIHIISGFLGAGKTTLIKYLLEGRVGRGKIAVLENEFGQVGLDGALLPQGDLQVLEISSGCICCSLTGDFRQALLKLVREYDLDEIIIEPSGVGLLSDIKAACYDVIQTNNLRKNNGLFKLKKQPVNENKEASDSARKLVMGAAVTVIDAKKYHRYLRNFNDFFVDQIAGADEILLTRTEMLTDADKQKCIEDIRMYNQKARIHFSGLLTVSPEDWNHILLDGKTLTQTTEISGDAKLREEYLQAKADKATGKISGLKLRKVEAPEVPAAEEVFKSLSYTVKECSIYTAEALRTALQAGVFGDVERFKGLVPLATVDGNPPVNWLHLEYAGGEWQRRLHSPADRNLLIFIGSNVNQEAIETFFKINELEFAHA